MIKLLFIWSFWFVILIGVGAIVWRLWLTAHYQPQIYENVDEVPAKDDTLSLDKASSLRVAIVFGAAINYHGPSAVLADRIEAAVALYQDGKVDKLLMTGDNRSVNYNEPRMMKYYAQQLGVPAEDIVSDYAGRRTYDSCYRADAIFAVEEAVLVTQRFHLPRALYLCENFGLSVVGLVADHRNYVTYARYRWQIRETIAIALAWFDLHIRHPLPILGEPLPIRQ